MNLDLRRIVGFLPHYLAFDVLEHARDPVAFLAGAARVLTPGGIAIIQTPIDRDVLDPPFGRAARQAFDDVEHCYLFTDAGMRTLAEQSGMIVRDLSERLWVQHEIAVFERPGALPAQAAA